MRRPLLLAVLLAAASCAPTPRPITQRPPPRVIAAAPPAVPLAADWRDWPATPGGWTYRADEQGSAALFGIDDADATAVLRCDVRGRRLYLSRAGTIATPLTIRTTSVSRVLQTGATGGIPPYVAAALSASDPLLDAIAFSRGRFVLDQAGTPPLVLPVWAEIGRVIEDCRA